MKGIEKINGKDLRDGDNKKGSCRCWYCNTLNIVKEDEYAFICVKCKKTNKIYDKR